MRPKDVATTVAAHDAIGERKGAAAWRLHATPRVPATVVYFGIERCDDSPTSPDTRQPVSTRADVSTKAIIIKLFMTNLHGS